MTRLLLFNDHISAALFPTKHVCIPRVQQECQRFDSQSYNQPIVTHIFYMLLVEIQQGIVYSNKSTNQMHQSLRFIVRRFNTAQRVSVILMPIIMSL